MTLSQLLFMLLNPPTRTKCIVVWIVATVGSTLIYNANGEHYGWANWVLFAVSTCAIITYLGAPTKQKEKP